MARGIRYAVDNGAKVLNLSLGRTGPASPVLQDALSYAVSRGAFVAIAAGNDFLDGNPTQRPADLGPLIDGMVTVGAIGRNRAARVLLEHGQLRGGRRAWRRRQR